MGRLKNRVAVVTGGSSGIGKAIALCFARAGASVVVASRSAGACDAVVTDIRVEGNIALAVTCDVRRENEVADLFRKGRSAFGKIDIVVTSAGISGGNTLVEEYSLADWNRVVATNLTGVFLTCREAFRVMKDHGGHIITLSSQAGVEGYARKGPYCAVKFGVRGLSQALAEEGRKHNISVSSLCPGTVATPILAATNTRVKNPMTPEAVADAALFLATLRGNAMVRDIILERQLTS